ncbi:MAG TPA: prenyltransferase/squalene oxidase repeat-containing protein [Solirubrobacterales bacterium]
MSWELASFLVIGAVLVAGFAWYERSRPPSQVVALVAALAALAIAGRIAFAAFPNVKPTTDIVIFAGYALGGAPGFAVGALAGLVSNFWFGQGPWTPWQMVGWGLCGVLGAALALGTRNAGRLTLAAVCGFAGIAYGALLNFSLMATYGGDLSLRHFLVLEARGIPFDAAHAIANVTLALIAGPAMVRMLARFRERFEWGRGKGPPAGASAGPPGPLATGLRSGGVAAILLLSLALLSAPPARAGVSAADRAAFWLGSAQNDDGGFGSSPGDNSSAAMTGWAMLGLEAAGHNPLDISRAGQTPIDYLRSHLGEISSTGDIARTIVALEGAGSDPRSLGGRNLVDDLLKRRRDDGSFEGWPGTTAFSVIALRTAGATGGLDRSVSWLSGVQNDDGGWGDVPGSPSTADGTGAAMEAIPGTKAAQRGLAYLRNAQRKGGGFPLGGDGSVNTQSTAWAIQGILAVGGDPASYRRGGANPFDYLSANQASDGHYAYSGSSNQTPVWVTGQVLVAASGKAFPLEPPAREPKPAAEPTPTPESAIPARTVPPPTVKAFPPVTGAGSVVPGGSNSGGEAGAPPGRFAPAGPGAPGAPATTFPPVGGVKEGSETPTQTARLASSNFDPPHQSPTIPLLIGLGLTAAIVLTTRALARRNDW